eukprot:TRINITY_DN14664_c0_g1_i2.p1 TRINITY_DN14664_c0_g1~~TRINITY_DN14664_c0_g1_i2.p1  ORF type:complete len:723 (-),score=107.71 TRINITY_DN14664_c0_g1_i2:486-2654(-)
MASAPRPKSQAAKTPAPKTPARSKTPTTARAPSAGKAKAKAKSKASSPLRKSANRKSAKQPEPVDPAAMLRTTSEKVFPTAKKIVRNHTASGIENIDTSLLQKPQQRRPLSQRSPSSTASLPSERPPPEPAETAEPVPEPSPPSPARLRMRTPELLRGPGARSSPAAKNDDGKRDSGNRSDNQTVASWIANDSKFRTSLPLNPAAEEEERQHTLHPTAEATMAKGRKRRGVKMYTNVPTQASTVDQVVFGRDLDFSNADAGYLPWKMDRIEYDGRAGTSTQRNGRAGGLKQVADAPQEQWSIAGDWDQDDGSQQGRIEPLSHLNSAGMTGAFGGDSAAMNDELDAAKAAFYVPGTGMNESAGVPSWKEQKSSARIAVHDAQGFNRADVDEVAQVMIHNEGPISEEKEVRGRRHLDSAQDAIQPDMAGRGRLPDNLGTKLLVPGVAGCIFRGSEAQGLNVADRGKRILKGYQDVGGEGQVAGSLTAHIQQNGIGFLPSDWRKAKLKDHGPRASQVVHGRGSVVPQRFVHRATRCITDKLIYQQLEPRMEPLVPTHQLEILGGEEKARGKKHLAHMDLPATQQRAVIYERPQSARQATPRSRAGWEGSSPPSRARSSVFDVYEPFVGAAGNPSQKRDRDAAPCARRAMTPPPSSSRSSWMEDAPVTPRQAGAGVPSERGQVHQSLLLGGQRRMRGSGSQGAMSSRHMHAGYSVAALLAWGDPEC